MSKEKSRRLENINKAFLKHENKSKTYVMAGLVINIINGERYDKPGEKSMTGLS